MGFLSARTTDEVELVWLGDPAIDSEGEGVVPATEAKIKKGKTKPDRFVVRPLSNRELFSIGSLSSTDTGLALAAVECCILATVRIIRADGTILKEEQIRDALDTSAPPEFIQFYAQAIYELTLPEDLADAESFRKSVRQK